MNNDMNSINVEERYMNQIYMSEKEELVQSSSHSGEEKIFFSLIERAGTMGRYQKFMLLLWCLVAYLAGGLMLMAPFLFFQDPYDCKGQHPSSDCLDWVCNKSPSERQEFIPHPTIKSIANKFGDYRCNSDMTELTWAITIMYGGAFLGVLLLSVFGDLVGRKNLMLLNLVIAMFGMVLTIFSDNLIMAGIGLFFCIFGAKNSYNITFIYVTETVSQKFREKFSVVIQTTFCVGGLANILWYFAIGDFQFIIGFFYGIPALVTAGLTFLFIKDTPICLLTKLSAQKVLEELLWIAKLNKKQDFMLTVVQLREMQQLCKGSIKSKQNKKGKTFSILDLFRYKSLRMMTLLLIVLDIIIVMQYYTPTLMLDQFNFSIYINGIVVQGSQIISSIMTYFIINRFGRRFMGWVCFGIVLVCSMVLIFIWDQDKSDVTDIGSDAFILILVFVLQFAITIQFNFFFLYFNELYPTQVRIIGIGFIEAFGGLILMLSSLIVNACINSGFKIMILFAGLAVISIVCSYVLPETFGKRPPDVIEELRNQVRKDEESNLNNTPEHSRSSV